MSGFSDGVGGRVRICRSLVPRVAADLRGGNQRKDGERSRKRDRTQRRRSPARNIRTERIPKRRGEDDQREIAEPNGVPEGEYSRDERREQRQRLVGRDPLPITPDDPNSDERKDVEPCGQQRRRAGLPLGDEATEGRVERRVAVVAEQCEAVRRCNNTRHRSEQQDGAAKTRAFVELKCTSEAHERDGEEDGAVQVRPQDEQREDKEDTS